MCFSTKFQQFVDRYKRLFALALFFLPFGLQSQVTEPIVLGYFPSWSETWVSANQDSPLRRIPSFVTHVFLSFGKPDLQYTAGSYDISQTGINVPYDGCALKESVSALNDKGIKVILSIGGETYWTSSTIYNNINYQQIKDLVDDMGFAGIDWDFEPNGSFAEIGNTTNVQHFINMITNSRNIMPESQGYIIACAPSGVGALGGQINNDVNSPFKFANRNTLTGETDANLYNGAAVTNGINLFGFSATGHMIPVFQACGNMIDIVAFQGYNCGGSSNREIMYDSFAYYAETYDFKVAAGVHYPNEPWGPYYTYTHTNVASLSNHIRNYPSRVGDNDGIMIWQLLMTGAGSSAYSYMNVASQVLNGTSQSSAIANATNFSMQPYTGGAEGCNSGGGGGGGNTLYCGVSAYNSANSYPTAGTQVYYNCAIWQNQWWANPGEVPGSNSVWVQVSTCAQTPSVTIASSSNNVCAGTPVTFTATPAAGAQNVSYQWKVNATNVGTNSSTYTSSTLNNGDVVTCVITASGSCGSGTSTSNTVTMVITAANATPSLTIASNSPGSICAGSPVTFTATPTNGGNTPSYQWAVNGVNAGTNSATFTTSSLTNGAIVTCTMTSSSTCVTTSTANSNAITMSVTNAVTPAVTIASNSPGSICAGTPVTFTATPTNGGNAPSYQWAVNGVNAGSNSPTFTTSSLTNGAIVTCTMTSNYTCTSTPTANSNTITMSVTNTVTPSVSITSNESGTICSGTPVTFTATPTSGGNAPTYQWAVNGVNAGTNTPTFTTSSLTNGAIVTCTMTSNSSCATTPTASSNAITMSVSNAVTPSVTIASNAAGTICSGTSVTFTATPTSGGNSPSYQWAVNGVNAGSNSPTFSTSSLTDGALVTCTMTSSSTCATTPTANSNTITIAVQSVTPPVVSVDDNCGSSTLTASGNQLQWSTNETSASIDVTSAGTYSVTQTINGCTSAAQTVTANPLPLPSVTLAIFESVCDSDGDFTLSGGSPSGGNYSGTAVTNNVFSPGQAGIGNWDITYTYVDNNGCENNATSTITVEDCAGVTETELSVSIFPNPATAYLMIKGITQDMYLEVADIAGKIVVSRFANPTGETDAIAVDSMESGIYLLTIRSGNLVHKTRFVVQ